MQQKKPSLKNKRTYPSHISNLPPKKHKSPKPVSININQERRGYPFIVESIKRSYKHITQTKMPENLKPMLATITKEPFNDGGWQFEIKWDGYRALVYTNKGKVEIRSRNNLSFNNNYTPIYNAFKEWHVNAVIDGEVVVLSENGTSDFNALQYWKQFQNGTIVFYAFDILWLDGIDLKGEPLGIRRSILKKILPDKGIIRYSDDIEEYGIDLFEAACNNGMEGIIAKKIDSLYSPGHRTQSWLKIKAEKRHEAVICGYTRKKDSERPFSSLILGMYRGKELVFIGQVGTGWTAGMQLDLMEQMKLLKTVKPPFSDIPPIQDESFWIKPKMVCEVKYTELTKEGVMRHPSFQGIRIDKIAEEVQLKNDVVIPMERNLKRNRWFRHPS